MQRYEDRSSMQAPGLCFVCETAPQAGVVDTLQNFTPGFPSNLDGRKYVCDGCVKALAEAGGFYATEDVVTAVARADAAVARFNAVRDHVAEVVKSFADEALVAVADASVPVVAVAKKARKVVAETPAPEVVDVPAA